MSTISATNGARVTRVVYEGAAYFPIIESGRLLAPDDVAALAARAVAPGPSRHFWAVVADESTPREGKPLRLSKYAPSPTHAIPLTYSDGPYTIGCIRSLTKLPAGAIYGTERCHGTVLIGHGRLYPNALAEIVWPAIVSGLVRGLCPEVLATHDQTVVRDITRIMLGGVENNCVASAVILETWEAQQ
jgi:hypothetical protein